MTQVTADFELGVNGNTISTGDAGSATPWDVVTIPAGGAIVYDNAHKYGNLAAKMTTGAGGGVIQLGWNSGVLGTLTDHYGRWYGWVTGLPPTTLSLVQYLNSGATALQIRITPAGKVEMIDKDSAQQCITTASISTGQFLRLEWHVVHGAGTGSFELKLFTSPDSGTAAETINATNKQLLAQSNQFRLGQGFSQANMGGLWHDNVVAGATSYPGPVSLGNSYVGAQSIGRVEVCDTVGVNRSDVLGVVVGPEGYYADVTFSGSVVGGAYAFGLDANTAPTATTPFLNVVSEGYNNAGTLGTITRKVYLTDVMRKAYPNHAQLQESISGSNLVVRFSLSEYVYVDDKNGGAGTSGTDATFTAPAGFFTNSGSGGGSQASAAIAGRAVTNTSTLAYPAVIANWSRPDRSHLLAPSVKLGAVAFHGKPKNQLPVACVKFTAADEHSHTISDTQTAPQIDATYGDLGGKVIEYLSTLNLSTFTDNDLVTCNFVAYPWLGDASCILDTAALAQTEGQQSPPQKYMLDADASHGYPMALVDPTAANDAAGVVYANDTAPNRTAAITHPYRNIYAAVRAIRDYVSTHGTPTGDNANDSVLYLRGVNVGTHDWAGGAVFTPLTVTSDRWSWMEVKGFPGDGRPLVTPNATQANRKIVVSGLKVTGVDFTRANDYYFSAGPGSGVGKIWCDDCTFVDTRTSNTYSLSLFDYSLGGWFTRCTINKIRVSNPQNLRGNSVPQGYLLPQATNVILGNTFTHVAGQTPNIISTPSSQANDAEGAIVAFNKFWKCVAPFWSFFNLVVTYTKGAAFVQNLIEMLDTTAQPSISSSADGTTATTTNLIFWHNTVVGQRCNMAYNDIGSVAFPHVNYSMSLNALTYFAHKDDDFSGQPGGANGGRTGGWRIMQGVWTWGNRMESGAFNQRYRGLWSKGGTDASPLDLGFVNRQAGSAGAGNGDYHAASGSTLRAIPVTPMLAWDIDGTARLAVDAAGAFSAPGSAKVVFGGDDMLTGAEDVFSGSEDVFTGSSDVFIPA